MKEIFESNITASHIASELKYCDINTNPSIIEELMKKHDFDVFGITDNNEINGYVEYSDFENNCSSPSIKHFDASDLIADSTPLIDVFPLLKEEPHRLFVLFGNQVRGIITISDLQKITIRMFLFGLISLLEMKMTHVIRNRYENESWKNKITSERLEDAQEVYDDKIVTNENIGLLDCLQFADKKKIILKSNDVIYEIGESKKYIDNILFHAMDLRDKLAHSRDLIELSGSKIIELSIEIDELLEKMSEID